MLKITAITNKDLIDIAKAAGIEAAFLNDKALYADAAEDDIEAFDKILEAS